MAGKSGGKKPRADMRNAVQPTGEPISYGPVHVKPANDGTTRRAEYGPIIPTGPFCHTERDAVSIERIGQGDLRRGWQEGREVGTGFRSVSTLVLMHDARTIGDEQLRAGKEFRDQFDVAQLAGMTAGQLGERIGGTARPPGLKADSVEDARAWIHEAMLALGGHGSNMGDTTWHIIGLGLSIRQYCAGANWRGKRPKQEAVSAHVEAALAVLSLRRNLRRKDAA